MLKYLPTNVFSCKIFENKKIVSARMVKHDIYKYFFVRYNMFVYYKF